MSFWTRLPKTLIVLWLLEIGIIALLWNFFPSQQAAWLLILLAGLNGVLLYRNIFELPMLTNVALTLSLAHFWQGSGFVSPLVASVLIFMGIALTGLLGQSLTRPLNRDDLLAWSLIGLFSAQIAIFTQFWPVTFFQKAALGLTIFYLIWQAWAMIDLSVEERRPIRAHFAFVIAAVIVIVGNIIWTTWPGLKNF